MDPRIRQVLNEVFTPAEKAAALYLLENPDVDEIVVYRDGSWSSVKYGRFGAERCKTRPRVGSIVPKDEFVELSAPIHMTRVELLHCAHIFHVKLEARGLSKLTGTTTEFINLNDMQAQLKECLKEDKNIIKVEDLEPGMLVYVTSKHSSNIDNALCEVVKDSRKLRGSTPPVLFLLITRDKSPEVLLKFVKSTENCWPYHNIDQVNAHFTFKLKR